MITEVEVKTIPAQPMAAVRGETTMHEISKTIRRLFDQYYAKPAPPPRGLNVVYYHADGEPDQFERGEAMPIECGTLMASSASPGVTGMLPAGRVVCVAYYGPYSGMSEPHNALVEYTKQHGLKRAGPFWEVYGHHNDDPAKLRIDVFHLLK